MLAAVIAVVIAMPAAGLLLLRPGAQATIRFGQAHVAAPSTSKLLPALPFAPPTPPPAPVPAAVAPVAAAQSAPAHPLSRLIISRIGVNAPVESVGTNSDGSMGVPATWNDVAWFNGATEPGLPGDAAIDGHLDSTTGPAVFWRVHELRPGDQLVVVFADGEQRTFHVTGSHSVAAGSTLLFRPGGAAHLILITCSGTWLRGQHQYSDRLVVDTIRIA